MTPIGTGLLLRTLSEASGRSQAHSHPACSSGSFLHNSSEADQFSCICGLGDKWVRRTCVDDRGTRSRAATLPGQKSMPVDTVRGAGRLRLRQAPRIKSLSENHGVGGSIPPLGTNPASAQKCHPCLRYDMSPLSQEGHYAKARKYSPMTPMLGQPAGAHERGHRLLQRHHRNALKGHGYQSEFRSN